uniref:Putative 7.8 kDa secreted protein n=1 Tax=Culex tarsalis TaxID=7177 RepID=A0A1Q3EUW1_CULTA
MFVLQAFIILLSLFTVQPREFEQFRNERDGQYCQYLQCAEKNVLGEKHCAAGENVLGYCMCLLDDGNMFSKYFDCEQGYVFNLKKGYCVGGKAKNMKKCDESGNPKKGPNAMKKMWNKMKG